jgi:hypothetical protein
MGPRRIALLLLLAASPACAQPAVPPASGPAASAPATAGAATGSGKHIFLAPPLQWDNAMLSYHPALQLTATDFANLTGGFAFGMSPTSVNAKLPEPYPGLSWSGLALANEFPGEARLFGVPIAAAGGLRMGLTACTGANSYLVFLFKANGLFRLSYRLTADKSCADVNEAAQQIYARFVPLGQSVAFSVRYRTGATQVVDITDPTADYLVPVRWHMGLN